MEALSQPLELVSVTNTVSTTGTALLNPKAALVGVAPVVSMVVKLASLYQV